MRRIGMLSLALVVGLAAAGCGSGDDESSAPTTTAGGGGGSAETVRIGETEYMLDPSSVDVDAAGTVTFHVVNNGSEEHALEVEGNGIEEEVEDIAPGDSGDLTVDLKPGTYEIYCPVPGHRERGMEGTLTVAGGGAGGGTTTDEDDDNGGGGTTTGGDDDGGYGYG